MLKLAALETEEKANDEMLSDVDESDDVEPPRPPTGIDPKVLYCTFRNYFRLEK